MKEFFLNMNQGFVHFKAFNLIHIFILILTFVLFLLVLINKKRLMSIKQIQKNKIRIFFGIILFFCLILRRCSFLYYNVYNWRYHLDLGFCNMTNILFIIYCFTGNKKVYNLCYYCSFCGPLISIVFPVIDISINNFSFINFIMIHNILFLMNIIFSIFENYRFSRKNFIIAYIFMFQYLFLCYCFNMFFETEYNHLNQLIIKSWQQNFIWQLIIENKILNYLVLVVIGTIMNIIGAYFLKLSNKGVSKYE